MVISCVVLGQCFPSRATSHKYTAAIHKSNKPPTLKTEVKSQKEVEKRRSKSGGRKKRIQDKELIPAHPEREVSRSGQSGHGQSFLPCACRRVGPLLLPSPSNFKPPRDRACPTRYRALNPLAEVNFPPLWGAFSGSFEASFFYSVSRSAEEVRFRGILVWLRLMAILVGIETGRTGHWAPSRGFWSSLYK